MNFKKVAKIELKKKQILFICNTLINISKIFLFLLKLDVKNGEKPLEQN